MTILSAKGPVSPAEENIVLLHEARRRQWFLFRKPREVLVADDTASVMAVLQAAEEKATGEGLYAAGFIAYEAAPAFDSALRVRPAGAFPLAWFGIYNQVEIAEPPVSADGAVDGISWSPSVSHEEYRAAIHRIKQYIQQGDTYQVNYTLRLRAKSDQPLWPLFVHLLHAQQGDYGALINTRNWAIASASPELFFDLQRRDLICRPMKGTVARGLHDQDDREKALWLQKSEKNRAENVMIVDMVRNDLGRIAEIGTVKIVDPFALERYPTLWQMTTGIRCRTDRSVAGIFQALFPAASITGAPKARTMEIIAELEEAPRRIYTGAIGFMGPQRRAQFNVAIRTVLVDHGGRLAEYGVGGGIVWDSDEKAERAECMTKSTVLTCPIPHFSLLETILWAPMGGYVLLDRHLERLGASAAYFAYSVDLDALRQKLTSIGDNLPRVPHRIRLLLPPDEVPRLEWEPLVALPQPYRIALAPNPIPRDNRFLYHKTTERRLYEDALAAAPGMNDVLLWNDRRELTESCIANIVVDMAGELVTPPVHCGLLAGIYRGFLIDQGRIREKIVTVDDLKHCAGLYLANAVRGMWKVSLPEVPGEKETGKTAAAIMESWPDTQSPFEEHAPPSKPTSK